MKACDICHVQVNSDGGFCPLCGEPLAGQGTEPRTAGEYPDLSRRMRSYSLARRALVFVTLLLCGLSGLINYLVTPGFMWSLIVIATAIYAWISVPPYLRHGVNFPARVVVQVLLTSALAMLLDWIIGWRSWSIDYVVPGLLIAGNVTVGMMILFNRTNHAQFVLYQIIMALFGFTPLLLYFTGISDNNLPLIIVATSIALASLLATLVFGDRTVKSEFKRRFHF